MPRRIGPQPPPEGKDAPLRVPSRAAVVVVTVCLRAVAALVTVLVSLGEPAIGAALGVPQIEDNLLGAAFLASQVCLLPLSGRLLSAWGAIPLLRRCALGFVLAALATLVVAWSGAASLTALSLLLALQGAFVAPLAPATQALVLRSYAEHERSRGLALWAAGSYVGFVLGALLAGWLVERVGWPSLFAVAPVVALVALPALRHDVVLRPRSPRAIRSRPALVLAAGACTLALVAALLAPASPTAARIVAAGAALAGVFAVEIFLPRMRSLASEMRTPVLNTLRDRWFLIAATLTFGIQALTTGQYEVLLLSGPLHLPAEIVSERTLVGGLSQIAAAAAAGFLLGQSRLRAAIAAALVIMAAGTAGYLLYVPGVDTWTLLWTRIVVGLGVGVATPALAGAAFRHLADDLTAQGATLFAVATSLGVLAGLVVLDAVFGVAKHAFALDTLHAYLLVILVETASLAALLLLLVPLRDAVPRTSAPPGA